MTYMPEDKAQVGAWVQDKAKELAETEYEKFHHEQIAQAYQAGSDFDKAIKQLPPPPKRKKGGKN